jgi:hypothetical protein
MIEHKVSDPVTFYSIAWAFKATVFLPPNIFKSIVFEIILSFLNFIYTSISGASPKLNSTVIIEASKILSKTYGI